MFVWRGSATHARVNLVSRHWTGRGRAVAPSLRPALCSPNTTSKAPTSENALENEQKRLSSERMRGVLILSLTHECLSRLRSLELNKPTSHIVCYGVLWCAMVCYGAVVLQRHGVLWYAMVPIINPHAFCSEISMAAKYTKSKAVEPCRKEVRREEQCTLV